MHLPRPDLTISRDGTLLALAAERDLAAVTPARTEALCKGGGSKTSSRSMAASPGWVRISNRDFSNAQLPNATNAVRKEKMVRLVFICWCPYGGLRGDGATNR